MPETPIKKTRDKLAKAYGAGILAFTAAVGSITLLARFLAHLNLT